MHTLQVAAQSSWLVHAAAATILVLHIAGGTIAIISGTIALAVRKGSRRHALAGNVFFVSMLVMASIGAFVSPFLVTPQGNPKLFDAAAAAFTCYLVVTSWTTVRRKPGTIGRSEKIAFAFASMLAATLIVFGARSAASATGLYGLGGFIALAAALDLKVILQGGIAGAPRISRHLWRMCLAFFSATLSFFVGQQQVMPEAIRGSPLLLALAFAPLAFMLFWLVRVRLERSIRAALATLRHHQESALHVVSDPDRRLAGDTAD